MDAESLVTALVRLQLAASAAILLVLLLRPLALRWCGAGTAYWLWLVVPLAAMAVLLPAREQVVTILTAPDIPILQQHIEPDLDVGVTREHAAAPVAVQPDIPDDPSRSGLLITLWLLGAGVLLIRSIVNTRRLSSGSAIGPALVGVLRPRLVLPQDFEVRFNAEERALILAHEEMHRVSRHTLVNALVEVARCASWFNPLVHWAAVRMRADQELACDTAVIAAHPEARRAYAEALLKAQGAGVYLPMGCVWTSGTAGRLAERIARLSEQLPGRRRRFTGAASIVGIGIAASYAAWAQQPARIIIAQQPNPESAAVVVTETPAQAPAQATIIAAAAAAPRVLEPPLAGQSQALAHLATKSASFMVRILPPVAEPPPRSMPATGARGAPPPTGGVDAAGDFLVVFQCPCAPPPTGGVDAAARARLEKYYAILVEKLTAVPGLMLITGATPGVPGADYEISIMLGGNWKGVQIEAASVENASTRKLGWTTRDASLVGTLLPDALSGNVPVDDPERDMERYVERMRLELFPADRALLDQMMSGLRDPRLPAGLRAQALRNLMTVDALYDSSGSRLDSFAGRLMTYPSDPALIGAAAEVAMTDKDPGLRLLLWNTFITGPLNPINPAVLVAPAARALASETDPRVQLTLVDILNLNAANPQARAALESAARNSTDIDRPELVRMAARRLLNGGADWNDYFVARLKDPQVPDAERVKLINYARSISSSGRWASRGSRMKLDEAAERSLGRLLKSPASTEVVAAAASMLGERLLPRSPDIRGSSVAYEELLDFLRAGTGKPQADPQVRGSVLTQLRSDLRLHPEARPVFEEIVARDSDPVLRERARQALEKTPQR